MKRINKLRLTQLSKAELAAKQMNALRGGNFCHCSCYYANSGGSSSDDNASANFKIGDYGGFSGNGCNQYYCNGHEVVYTGPGSEN